MFHNVSNQTNIIIDAIFPKAYDDNNKDFSLNTSKYLKKNPSNIVAPNFPEK